MNLRRMLVGWVTGVMALPYRDVWIDAVAVIRSGVIVRPHRMGGAESVATRGFPVFAVLAGVPAQI